jgi:hypothetical protein
MFRYLFASGSHIGTMRPPNVASGKFNRIGRSCLRR